MPTRDFKETVRERAQSKPEFREELLKVAASSMLNGEPDVGWIMLRDFVIAAIGVDELSQKTGMPREDLERMVSDEEDPSADELLGIVATIAKYQGVELDVHAERRSHVEQPLAA